MPHQDPPVSPGLQGWGDPSLQPRQNLAVERMQVEDLASRKPPLIVAAAAAEPAGVLLPKIEAMLRKLMLFEEGWSFLPAEKLVYGEQLWQQQNIGNCVGSSHCMLLAARIAHEILAEGEAEDPLGTANMGIPFIPYSYGAGRLAGDMLGPGDGSYCGAQIEGTQEYGFLPCYTTGLEAYGSLPQSSSTVGRLFGRSKSEILKWQPQATQFDLVEAPRCRSADEAWDLVVEKKIPLQICSGWGFKYSKFDSTYGVHLYRPGGSWSHSMQVMAMFGIKGQRFACIRNQWGIEAHKGSPEIGIPGTCFVITIEDFARWVKDSETIGIGQIKGLEANPGF